MTAIKAYYDGTTFVPLQEFNFKPSQQVLIVVDDNDTDDETETPAQKFLKLFWAGSETAKEILGNIEECRKISLRFEE